MIDDEAIDSLLARWQKCRNRREREWLFGIIHRRAITEARKIYLATAPGMFAADPDAAESDMNLCIFKAARAANG